MPRTPDVATALAAADHAISASAPRRRRTVPRVHTPMGGPEAMTRLLVAVYPKGLARELPQQPDMPPPDRVQATIRSAAGKA